MNKMIHQAEAQEGANKTKEIDMIYRTTTLPNAFPNIQTTVQTTVAIAPETKKFKAKKAGTKGFHCFLVLDESGSMSSLKNDTIGGVNSYIKKQAEDNDGTNITIVKFEGGQIRVPVKGVPATKMGNFTDYQPAGGTNLLDAVGTTLNMANDLLKSFKKADRPSIFIQIVTDGQENQSRNFSKEDIQGMVGQATEADWIITYVGANVDAFAESHSLGISSAATSNYVGKNTKGLYDTMAVSMTSMKSMRAMGMTANAMYSTNSIFSDEDRKKLEEE